MYIRKGDKMFGSFQYRNYYQSIFSKYLLKRYIIVAEELYHRRL